MKNWVPTFTLLLVLAHGSLALACPMCKDSVDNPDTGAIAGPGGTMGGPSSGLPGGFNTSVYLMLVGFFGSLGLVAFTLTKGIRGTGLGSRGFPVEPREDDTSNDERRE